MKMKSAVLASALVAVSAAFATDSSLYDSEVIYTNWFNVAQSSAVKINEDVPVFFVDNAADLSNGYAVTAVVSVVIHAAVPTSAPTNITVNSNTVLPKGSICAAYDGGVAKWYGLQNDSGTYSWVPLTTAGSDSFTPPTENTTYTLVTEFDDLSSSSHLVRYSVISDNTTQTSGWYTSGHANALQKVGLAGTGYYTKVVGLLVNAWTKTIAGVPISVDKTLLASMCQALSIPTANTTPAAIEAALKAPAANGIAKWANYVLGIDGTNEANKPFAAPVQNSTASTLTFKLGGVKPPAGTGATVKYAVETLDSPNDSYSGALTYKSASDTTDINLVDLTEVQYYRVKVQIDQTQAQAGN